MDFSCSDFQDLVKNVLKDNQSKEGTTGIIAQDIVDALLQGDFDSTSVGADLLQTVPNISPLTSENHYPRHPLYKEVANRLFKWMESSQHPSESLQRFELLEQTRVESLTEKALQKVGELLNELKVSWKTWIVEEREVQVAKVLGILDKRMLLDLLGIRHTVGSVDFFPPPVEELVNSFCKKHKANSNLSVGARALSKHCHRDNTSMFWGVCTGSENAKNTHACTILQRILNEAAWINIHMLPHDVKVIEIRCGQGYGARWLHDGSEFRGFLEPQMADGHSVKWRH